MAKSHRPNPKRPNASRIDKPSEISTKNTKIYRKTKAESNE